jgi:hypothetical protein
MCDDSTFAVWGNASLALEMPLVQSAAELAPLLVGKHGLDYGALSNALGFDPLMDLDEVFVTDAGRDDAGELRLVVVLRYGQSIEDVDVVLKLVGAASGGPAVTTEVIAGRDVFFLDEPRLAVALLDGSSVALLVGFDPAGARIWMDSAMARSEVRLAAAQAVSKHAADPHLGSPELLFLSAWIDMDAHVSGEGVLRAAGDLISAGGLSAWSSAETAVLFASHVDGEMRLKSRVVFADAGTAAAAADSFEESRGKPPGVEGMPFMGNMIGEVDRTLEVEITDEIMTGRWAVPRNTLEKMATLTRFLVGLAVMADGLAGEDAEGGPMPWPTPGI